MCCALGVGVGVLWVGAGLEWGVGAVGCVANGEVGWWGGACGGLNRLASVVVDGRCKRSSLP